MERKTTDNNPLVSIIIPVFNGEKYISECIDSVLSQSYEKIEIILIDDGSTDRTGCICDNYLEKDDRIIVLHQNNQGQAAARNKGLEKASGQWICFVDGDDAIHPQTIDILLHMAVAGAVPISICSLQEVQCINTLSSHYDVRCFHDYRIENVDEDHIYSESFGVWCITGKLIKREVLETKSLTNGKIYEDNAVILYWLSEAGRVAVTREALYYYRINPESTTKKQFSLKKLDFLWAIEQRISFCIETGYSHLLSKYLIQYIHSTRQMCQELEKVNLKHIRKELKRKALDTVLHSIRYSSEKMGVLLRALKMYIVLSF